MTPPKVASDTPASADAPHDATATVAPGPAPDANVDKIREILFGGQMQDYEQRFTMLENRLAAAAAELREETRGRLDALEAYAKKELAALGDRLSAERDERSDAVASASAEAEAAATSIEQRLAALDERAAGEDADLRDQLLQQSKSLGDDLRRVQRTLTELIDQETRALRASKTDRRALAGLLADVAMRLSETEGPEDDES